MGDATLPNTIKALQVQEDKANGVKLVEIPFASQDKVQNLPADEIIIRVRAVGLNPTDWKHALGAGPAGSIAGCDSAGDVVKVSSAVKHLKVGDRASGFTYGGGAYETDNGSFAEYVRLVGAICFKLPDGMTYEEAASFPVPHLTAVQALYLRLKLPLPSSSEKSKESILIWGGSTAVGTHAVQLAAHSGLRVFVTASPDTHDSFKKLGAYQCFDYKDPEVVSKIRTAAGEPGITFGLDNVCEKGSTEMTIDSLSSKHGGTVITLLTASDEAVKRRAEVKVERAIAYTLMGVEIPFRGGVTFPAVPEDKTETEHYVINEMPPLLSGWKAGEGSPKFKTQHLRKMSGGLDNILEGLKIMKEGKYGREKIVYTIA